MNTEQIKDRIAILKAANDAALGWGAAVGARLEEIRELERDLRSKSPSTPSPAEQWTPEQRGRALHFIIVLANTPPDGWRSKPEIYEALAEFRLPQVNEDSQ